MNASILIVITLKYQMINIKCLLSATNNGFYIVFFNFIQTSYTKVLMKCTASNLSTKN